MKCMINPAKAAAANRVVKIQRLPECGFEVLRFLREAYS